LRRIFQNIVLWVYLKIHTLGIAIGIALFNTETEILKANPNDLDERNNHTQRMRSRNQVLEKFNQGQTDEKYVQDYYEVLKKADKFIRTATPRQMAVAADKYGTSYGMKDKWGRRYEHYGFFDDKHKSAGKTMGEVIALEFEERRTKDDELEIMYIFNNSPIEVGLKDVFDSVGEKTKDDEIIDVVDINKASKQYTFPISVMRENDDAVNKIEELSEFLHVKKIGFEHRQLEFFIPLKYKTSELDVESDIFKEIINVEQVFIRDEYGELIGFGVNKYIKRINYNDTHEVLKFDGIEMETVGIKK